MVGDQAQPTHSVPKNNEVVIPPVAIQNGCIENTDQD